MKQSLYSRGHTSSTLREVFWFGFAGGINAGAYLGISILALSVFGAPAVLATTAGYVASVLVSFVLNATLTFEKGSVKSAKQAGKFAALYLIGYTYNIVIIGLGSDILGWPFFLLVAFVTVTWPVCSFLVSKYIVFT